MSEYEDKLLDHLDRLYNAAYEYLDRGWSFIPCSPMGKEALIPWKDFQTSPTTEEQVEEWFGNGVTTKHGVVRDFDLLLVTGNLSGVVVVDCDNEDAVTKAKELGLSSNVMVQTRKGIHYYWLHDGSQRFPNKVGANVSKHDFSWPEVNGLDFRGDGGVCVLPPSRRKDGKTYEWIVDYDEIATDRVWQVRTFPKDVTGVTDQEVVALLNQGQLPPLGHVSLDSGQSRSVEDEIEDMGGAISTGGRNATLTRLVGKLVSDGVSPADGELFMRAMKICEEYMEEPLPEFEVLTICNSVVEKDMREKPWRYDEHGNFIHKKEPVLPNENPIVAQPLVTRRNAAEVRKSLGKERFLMYPAIQHPTIAQVYGYSGHGKSLFVGHMMYALACGRDFAVYENMPKGGRVLYLDFENSLGEIVDRLDLFHETFGRPEDDEGFAVYSPANKEAKILDLRSDDGLREVLANARAHEADVIVIDTLRTAFSGFDENRSQDWAIVNNVLLTIRNAGFSVIGIHHANKPQQTTGSSSPTTGTEAGSTNQLTLLETQMRVTQIFADTEDGRQRAEEVRGVVDDAGWRILDDIRTRREDRDKEAIRMSTAIRVSYGKVRSRTEAHRTCYIGFGEALVDGKPLIIASTPLRGRIKWLAEKDGSSIEDISREYNLSVRQIQEWLS